MKNRLAQSLNSTHKLIGILTLFGLSATSCIAQSMPADMEFITPEFQALVFRVHANKPQELCIWMYMQPPDNSASAAIAHALCSVMDRTGSVTGYAPTDEEIQSAQRLARISVREFIDSPIMLNSEEFGAVFEAVLERLGLANQTFGLAGSKEGTDRMVLLSAESSFIRPTVPFGWFSRACRWIGGKIKKVLGLADDAPQQASRVMPRELIPAAPPPMPDEVGNAVMLRPMKNSSGQLIGYKNDLNGEIWWERDAGW